MTGGLDLEARRAREQKRIRIMMNAMRAEERAKLKGGEDAVAWVKEELCIGCCLLYTSPSPRDVEESRMPSSA